MPHQIGFWKEFLDALNDCFPEELVFRNPQEKTLVLIWFQQLHKTY